MFRPVQESSLCSAWNNQSMAGPYFHSMYNSVLQNIMKDSSEDMYWTNYHDVNRSFSSAFFNYFPQKLRRHWKAQLWSPIPYVSSSSDVLSYEGDRSLKSELFNTLPTNAIWIYPSKWGRVTLQNVFRTLLIHKLGRLSSWSSFDISKARGPKKIEDIFEIWRRVWPPRFPSCQRMSTVRGPP